MHSAFEDFTSVGGQAFGAFVKHGAAVTRGLGLDDGVTKFGI